MRAKIKIYLLLFGMAVSFSACSYKEAEDSLKEKISDVKEEANRVDSEKDDKEEEENSSIGKSVTWKDYYEQELQYTLKDVKTAKNINELGIKKEDFLENAREAISEDGNIIGEDSILVQASINIKNINFKGYDKGKTSDMLYKVYIDNNIDTKEDMNGEGLNKISAAYFSGHSAEEEYYMFQLKEGEEKLEKLVWIVPKKSYEEEQLCYVIGEANGEYQYLRIN